MPPLAEMHEKRREAHPEIGAAPLTLSITPDQPRTVTRCALPTLRSLPHCTTIVPLSTVSACGLFDGTLVRTPRHPEPHTQRIIPSLRLAAWLAFLFATHTHDFTPTC